jgi:hypothetical protein
MGKTFVLFALFVFPLWAAGPRTLPADLDIIDEERGHFEAASLEVVVNNGEENLTWALTPIEKDIFLGRLLGPARTPHPDDELFGATSPLDPGYKGIEITLTTFAGDTIAPLVVHAGYVKDKAGHILRLDPGRRLELWLFGTAKIRRQQLLAVQVIPVFTFEQCRLLGNLIVETDPRQCLLPDNNLLLEVDERPTVASLQINDFDSCLQDGQALIGAFPRRCVAPGGRVFTEPPRLSESGEAEEESTSPVNIDTFLKEYRQE